MNMYLRCLHKLGFMVLIVILNITLMHVHSTNYLLVPLPNGVKRLISKCVQECKYATTKSYNMCMF
jgi:hypothetical protein